MTLRKRLALLAAGAVGIVVLIAALVCYTVVRNQLRGQVDNALRMQATAIENSGSAALDQQVPGIPASAGGPAQYAQAVLADGIAVSIQQYGTLPWDAHVVAVARGRSPSYMTDVSVGGSQLRELVFQWPVFVRGDGPAEAAIQLARPLDGVDRILSNLRLVLLLLGAGGVALAAVLSRLAARRVLAPLHEVAETAQQIGETDDLSRRLRIYAEDEVGQLARRFNAMLEHLEASRAALDESVRAQRQLVADASHELRTPVTSLRTNVEVLLESGELGEEDRRRLLHDVVEQSEELTELVADLIELARGDQPAGATEDVRLDRLMEQSVAWARRNAGTITFATELAPVTVEGVPERLERAVNNLLDNAARHSPPGGTVHVTVDEHGVTVRDHGDGIAEDELPHVFDRFFRGANSRHRQGSGLGLAIVKQVAEQHGGSVTAANAHDGGAIFRLALPARAAEDCGEDAGEPVGADAL
ncbi:MAG: HAMP domain-containing sensor histidine kinase [Solirubrobacteraceae bacterium]